MSRRLLSGGFKADGEVLISSILSDGKLSFDTFFLREIDGDLEEGLDADGDFSSDFLRLAALGDLDDPRLLLVVLGDGDSGGGGISPLFSGCLLRLLPEGVAGDGTSDDGGGGISLFSDLRFLREAVGDFEVNFLFNGEDGESPTSTCFFLVIFLDVGEGVEFVGLGQFTSVTTVGSR